MKKIIVTAVLLILNQFGYSQNIKSTEDSKINLDEYIDFLKSDLQDPVDYVMGLFENYDIVILCERSHSEITQYELFKNIINDQRFINTVGHVFHEIGNSDLQAFVEDLLMNNKLSRNELNEKLRYIARNCSSSPLWTYSNYFEFVKEIYELNKRLSKSKKIRFYPSNMSFSWEGMNYDKYYELKRNRPIVRDSIIAGNVINKIHEINNSSGRKKALVIMNFRHAFPHIDIEIDSTKRQIKNVGGYLAEEFPGKVANVMINSVKITGGTDDDIGWSVVQDGKWDASFALSGNKDAGFNFKGSPFGKDKFDYFPFTHHYLYSEIFTGFIFYKALQDHVMKYGLEGVINDAFKKEFYKRYKIIDKEISNEEIEEMTEEYNKVSEHKFEISDTDAGKKINALIKLYNTK